MTLDETIKRVEEIAEEHEKKALLYSNDPFGFYKDNKARCENCAEEHRQLAAWLRELKEYKTKYITAIECNDLSEEDKARLIDLLKKPAPVTVTCDCQPIVREFPAACSDKMTKTEAIELIERNKSVFQYDDEMLQALEVATGALKYLSLYEGD